jgi:dienelactone hydrolase
VARASFLAPIVALALLAGCGGGGKSQHGVVERSVGKGEHQVWLFEPKGREPKALVIFLHGLGGVTEDTPANHSLWLQHLADRGNAVLYPRYEKAPGDSQALRFLLEAIPPAAAQVRPRHLPVVVIGYSRGGGLAVDYADLAPQSGKPRAVLAVFPVLLDARLTLRAIPPRVRFLFLVGDKDTQVGSGGATDLLRQLIAAGYPRRLLSAEIVRSHGYFQATHLSVLETSPAARHAFWSRADRLISTVLRAG